MQDIMMLTNKQALRLKTLKAVEVSAQFSIGQTAFVVYGTGLSKEEEKETIVDIAKVNDKYFCTLSGGRDFEFTAGESFSENGNPLRKKEGGLSGFAYASSKAYIAHLKKAMLVKKIRLYFNTDESLNLNLKTVEEICKLIGK
jgi:hypothetical protein